LASAAGKGEVIRGRVTRDGRLVEADPMLIQLQEEGGGALGGRLVLPQLAAIARLAMKLGIEVARPALVAGRDHDLEMWVRCEPEDDEALIEIESWRRRAPAGPRLDLVGRGEEALPAAKGEWATDAELRVSFLSPELAELLGTSPAEAVGQPLTRWLRLVESEDGALPMLAALAARTPFADQHAVGRTPAAPELELSGAPAIGGDGAFTGFRGRALPIGVPPGSADAGAGPVGLDPALDEALRSPIDRIIEAAEDIAGRAEGPLRADYAVYAGDIAAAARHLLAVIQTMVAEPHNGPSEIELRGLANEAVGLVEPIAEEKQVRLTVEGAESLVALGEPRAVVQILVNLLGNAVRHSPAGTAVTVTLGAGTQFATVTVGDEGPGIAQSDQQRIFERFERGSEGGGSSGLGLAIARRLARTMEGDITLVSALGKGARFTLSLPLAGDRS
jgi:anti-sigma regulatory factor (Ser/Thr protein kinase)